VSILTPACREFIPMSHKTPCYTGCLVRVSCEICVYGLREGIKCLFSHPRVVGLFLCVCVYSYVFTHMSLFICVYSDVFIHVFIHMCLFICVYSYVFIHMCLFICVYSYVFIHMSIAGYRVSTCAHCRV